jgi:polyisoprenoid-binding protein YceI
MRAPPLGLALAVALAALSQASNASAQTAATRAIDAIRSRATFSVQHVFVDRVTGSVPILDGSVMLAPDSPIPLSLTAELDPSQVTSGDRDRDAALRSPDFFDVKADPVWTFTSTKIAPLDASHFGIDGALTIHGVTQPEHLDVTIRGEPAHPTYHAVGRLDRHAFHMAVTRLDPAIGGNVDVILDIVLK